MKKILVLILSLLSFNSFAIDKEDVQKAVEYMISAGGASALGATVVFSAGGSGAVVVALMNAAVAMEASVMAIAVTEISTATYKSFASGALKEALEKESADYQMTGEMGLVLSAGVESLKLQKSDLSDAEAVDILLEALN